MPACSLVCAKFTLGCWPCESWNGGGPCLASCAWFPWLGCAWLTSCALHIWRSWRLAVTVCLPFALHRTSTLLNGEPFLLTGGAGALGPHSLAFLLSLSLRGEPAPPEGMGGPVACDAAGR